MSSALEDVVRIPSYDDLTPGIPDEVDAKSVSQLALFLRDDVKRRAPSQDPSLTKKDPSISSQPSTPSSERQATALYACLRTAAAEPPTANCELRTLLEIARDFSPRIMVAGDHEILLDVSGLGRLIGEPPAIAAALTRAIADAGITAGVAIAPTQTAARLWAAAEAGLSSTALGPGKPCATGVVGDLASLPVRLLQPLETLPPAMPHRDRAQPYDIFERWGILTLADLAALPAADLSSRLGRRGIALQRLARGLDPRPFVPDEETPRYIGRLELEWPLEALEPLSFVVARLLEPLSAALERADRGAAAIRLALRLTTRDTHTRVLQLPVPMRDARVLRTLLLLDLESHPPFGGASEGRREPPRSGGPSAQRGGVGAPSSEVMIDIVSIELDPAPARITQFSLLERALPSPETVSTLTARLSALVGESRIGSAVLLDTHHPGAFAMTRFAPEAPVGRTSQVRLDAPGLRDPACSAVLRRQRTPPAIRVRVEHGRPVYLAAARRGMPQGAVTQAAGPWRTSGGWWAIPPASDLRPKGGSHEISLGSPKRSEGVWNRDEWDVALRSGAVCRIYQDRTTERWFLEGTYD